MGDTNGSGVEVDPDEVQVLQCLGSGTFAQVFLVEFNGAEAAAKVIQATTQTRRVIEREVKILKRVQHPNIVACIGTCEKQGYCYILQEFCAGGALFELLHNCDHIELSWIQRWQLLHDCASGMEHLHATGIIHRDLKSLNCLLASPVLTHTDQVLLKVADFGLGKTKDSSDWGKMTIAAGTCHWMAPEVLKGSDYAEPVDVYSYSMVMFEIICREVPFEDEEPAAVGAIVESGGRPDMDAVPPDCLEALSALMVKCWDGEAGKRPAFAQICASLEGMRDAMYSLPVPVSNTALPVSLSNTNDHLLWSDDNILLPQPSLPEDMLPLPEPDQEPRERISDVLKVEVRCDRSRASSKRRELLGMITVICPESQTGLEDHQPRSFCSLVKASSQPSEEPEPSMIAKERLGLDLVLVLDVSASMLGEKMQMLKQAARFIVKELGANDRLAIVSFSTTAQEHLNFCRMDENGQYKADRILEFLETHSQTSIAAGLRLGVGIADARRSRNPVCGLLLLTDGQNNYGNLPATLLSDARQRGLSTFAFGIGKDHDAALLGRIAEQARTPVAYIEKAEALSGAFAATVGGLLNVHAYNIELRVNCIGRTELRGVHSPYLEELASTNARLVLPELFAGERRDVLLELDAPSGHELLEVFVSFHDQHGLTSVPKCCLQISRGEPEAEPDDDITAQRERLAVANLLKSALQEGRAGHVIKARKILEEALQRPWRPEHRCEIETSLKQAGADRAGFASLADVAQMHSHQRCLYSSPGLGGSNGSYLTNGQLQAIARST